MVFFSACIWMGRALCIVRNRQRNSFVLHGRNTNPNDVIRERKTFSAFKERTRYFTNIFKLENNKTVLFCISLVPSSTNIS